jgi:hypothetical protein
MPPRSNTRVLMPNQVWKGEVLTQTMKIAVARFLVVRKLGKN